MDLVQDLTRAEGTFYPCATLLAPSDELHRDMLSYVRDNSLILSGCLMLRSASDLQYYK